MTSDTANTVEGKMLGKRLSTHRLEAIRRDPVGAAPMRGSLKDIVSELLDHIAATEASDVLENLMTCTEALTGAQIEIAALQSLVTRLEGERDEAYFALKQLTPEGFEPPEPNPEAATPHLDRVNARIRRVVALSHKAQGK